MTEHLLADLTHERMVFLLKAKYCESQVFEIPPV